MRDNVITVTLGEKLYAKTDHVFQYDYGLRLVIDGIQLPETYEVHFSENKTGLAKKVTGDATGVDVPDEYLTVGSDIYAWIYIRDGDVNGYTVYNVQIPVVPRAVPDDEAITPIEHNVIQHALEEMEDAVEQTQANVTHYPVIGDNGNWMVWDAVAEHYQDTNVKARGEDGKGANIAIGEVTTLGPGEPATANTRVVGDVTVLDLGLPIGISVPVIFDERRNANQITVEDGADNTAIAGIELKIIPQRTGTGDPSPRNIRNFIGYEDATLYVNDNEYTFDWSSDEDIVYSGTINPLTGVMTIDKRLITYRCTEMNNDTMSPGWKNSGISEYVGEGVSMIYDNADVNVGTSFGVDTTNGNDILYMPYERYNMRQADWINTEINVRILIPLPEPVEINLTQIQPGTVLGHNVFEFDAGSISYLKYPCDVKLYIDQKVAGLQAMILEG